MATYDYDRQKWVEVILILSQLRDHLALLETAEGDDYAAFIGVDQHQAIKDAHAAIRAATGAPS